MDGGRRTREHVQTSEEEMGGADKRTRGKGRGDKGKREQQATSGRESGQQADKEARDKGRADDESDNKQADGSSFRRLRMSGEGSTQENKGKGDEGTRGCEEF